MASRQIFLDQIQPGVLVMLIEGETGTIIPDCDPPILVSFDRDPCRFSRKKQIDGIGEQLACEARHAHPRLRVTDIHAGAFADGPYDFSGD